MTLADNQETKRQVERLLENWGRWCRDDWFRKLGYVPPMTSRRYIAPRGKERIKAYPPINEDDGWKANEAIINLGVNGHFDEHRLLIAWYAHGHSAVIIGKMLGWHRATVYRKLPEAADCFWQSFQQVS